MNPQHKKKKIPGILGLLVLLIGVAITVYLAGTTTHFFQHAATSENPEDIRITNITDTSFTFTYKTQSSFNGTLTLQDGGNQTILDDRDQKSGTPHPYTLHSITAKNLSPQTKYSFSILSNTTTFLNNGTPFSVTTAAKSTSFPTETPPVTGKVVGANGAPVDEVLVFLTTPNGQTLSTLTEADGIYILPINIMRTKDLSEQLTFTANTPLQILAVSPDNSAHASLSIGSSNPVPLISLGQEYDFTLSVIPVASTSAAGGFPEFSLDESLKATPQILTPEKPDQSFTDPQPLFKGTAPPNEEVTITIHSDDVITKTVTADSNGNWSFRPSTPLSPGQHTITITTKNQYGVLQTIERSFTVYAAGTQIDQSTTPVPTGQALTQAPKPTATPTPKPKVTSTPTPIKSGSTPTPQISLSPTATPTVGPSSTPTTIPAHPTSLPPTGSNATVVIGIAGILTSVLGMMIFLLTRGAVL